jgi:23S rRNA G2445 N2-methylase RlmL
LKKSSTTNGVLTVDSLPTVLKSATVTQQSVGVGDIIKIKVKDADNLREVAIALLNLPDEIVLAIKTRESRFSLSVIPIGQVRNFARWPFG